MCRVAGQQQRCSKTSWLQEACAGACALCYMQERTVVFPGMREALCHSPSRRRGLLWLRFQCGGQQCSCSCCGMGHALPPVPPERAAWPLAAWDIRDKKNKFGGVRLDDVVKAVGHYRLSQQYLAQDTCPVLCGLLCTGSSYWRFFWLSISVKNSLFKKKHKVVLAKKACKLTRSCLPGFRNSTVITQSISHGCDLLSSSHSVNTGIGYSLAVSSLEERHTF